MHSRVLSLSKDEPGHIHQTWFDKLTTGLEDVRLGPGD
jgi:hypothetical protein